MTLYNNNSLILKLKFLMGLIQNLNRVNQNHSYGKFVIVLIFECLKRIKQQLLLIIFVVQRSHMKLRSLLFYLTIICDIKSLL
jgi:hypothetical protein